MQVIFFGYIHLCEKYLDTCSGFEAAKTLHGRVGDHHFGKFLEPSDSELVDDAIAS